ncbi:hypothetical protein KEU06_22215 [Pseudaminobacter sp. 19-2017]|uniref:Uncharacterized protein n=1 Tax=Pseudaminobacter soli (ex Zhang et al. 2022) TaxID=2831468 RepID=A0A942I442_9HYPH|nr:hypothetical protein [Pseudaminobacter soli]MBS3651333.1 hypothetical protein [Pseudaminobacter soli]
MLSLADAVRSVRSIIPHCELLDSELAELIACRALKDGIRAIDWDMRPPPLELEIIQPPRLGPSTLPEQSCVAQAETTSIDLVSFLPELIYSARMRTQSQRDAECLIEQTLRVALARLAGNEIDRFFKDWLLDFVRQEAAAGPHHVH